MKVSEVMNKTVEMIDVNAPVMEAAAKMRDGDFGVLPVTDGDSIVGIVTDRDLAVRIVAEGKDSATTTVEQAMTPDTLTCNADDETDEVADFMAERQVRRLVVLGSDGKIAGMVSIGDIAIANQDQAGEALGGISERRHDDPGAKSLQ